MFTLTKYAAITVMLVLNVLCSQYTQAHVMVAQHGTLNFVDDGVYMVLSLPVSAFKGTDDNKDGKMSNGEFDRHQGALALIIKDKVALSDDVGKLLLKGLMLSPLSSHEDLNGDASQLVVMGKFELNNINKALHFQLNLFGNTATEQSIEITARNRHKDLKQVFVFTPTNTSTNLFEDIVALSN